jgi:hypothetical protein
MTRDIKAHRFPQAISKMNGSVNMAEMRRRENLDPSEKANVMFNLAPLEGEMGDAKILLAEGDVAFIMRSQYGTALPKNEQRTFMNQNNAMAATTLINGLPGTPEAIENTIEPVGWIEQGNEENRSAETNIIRGGSFTILYNGEKPARQNAYLIVKVPDRDQAAKMKSDKASHARGADGAVPLMYAEYDPLKTTFLSAEKLYRIFDLGGEGGKHAFGEQAEKEAKSFVAAMAQLHIRLSGNLVTGASEKTAVERIKNLIKTAVEDPSDKNSVAFLSSLNTYIQSLSNFRLNKDRLIVCKTHHGASNGLYVSVDGGRYGF